MSRQFTQCLPRRIRFRCEHHSNGIRLCQNWGKISKHLIFAGSGNAATTVGSRSSSAYRGKLSGSRDCRIDHQRRGVIVMRRKVIQLVVAAVMGMGAVSVAVAGMFDMMNPSLSRSQGSMLSRPKASLIVLQKQFFSPTLGLAL